MNKNRNDILLAVIAGLVIGALLCFVGCQTQPTVVVPVQTAPVVQQQTDPYQVYTDAYGNQSVYYTDPYYHTSYWLDYAIFMSMWNSPSRYTVIHNYYNSNRSYITSRNSYYSRTYTRRYNSSSPAYRSNNYRPFNPASGGSRFSPSMQRSAPSNPSFRSSSPSSSRSFRSSSPSRRH